VVRDFVIIFYVYAVARVLVLFGVATLTAGEIRFAAGPFALLRRRRVLFHVDGIELNRQRALLPWDANSTGNNFVIVPIRVTGAKLDWAVPFDHLDRAVGDLRRS
jgi:hypothetical protein